jgi:Kdo2-lipid IVA lauroyltransferase/acyltransferase
MQTFTLGWMRLMAILPLSWVRAFGWVLGACLFLLVRSRRHVVRRNLTLCFPRWTPAQRQKVTFQVFVHFAQAWLDRGWLWHADPQRVRQRVKLVGHVDALQGQTPCVIFAPHFMGLDAAWTGLTQQIDRAFTTIYTDQSNQALDAWILQGRQRFGRARLFGRADGVKTIVGALRAGEILYLLPDMNFGPEESVFVPFYGLPACTVPSLSRFARLTRARVVPVLSRMTAQGYEVEVALPWSDFPTHDAVADTASMNERLQTYIDGMPDQYYWVHKRFKDLPPGYPPAY